MRNILNISLPPEMARTIKIRMKEENFASVSEFIRHVIRKYEEEQLYQSIQRSEAEYRAGKTKILRSFKDLR